VLVGEIRDKETATIAVQASLTGHLVLSTLHTNDAPNAVTRLVDMGIEAFKLGPALRGVIAQRLMRKLCTTCRQVSDLPVPERVRRFIPRETVIYRSVGCPDCAMTGYRGRFSVVEVLTMSPELERVIGSGGTPDRIAEVARSEGMLSLFESGLRHVLSGETSIEELLRVVDVPMAEGGASGRPSTSTVSRPSGAVGAPPEPVSVQPVQSPSRDSGPSAVPDLSNAFELLEHLDGGAETPHRKVVSRNARVLLVDDEDSLRKVMTDLLVRDGFDVVEARNGVEALDQVDRHAPDVVVLDLNLPGMDGYSVLSELRARSATRHVPVIVLTAKGDEDNEVRVFELGADDFLSKPFRAKALTKRLELILSRRP
jgi:CheY-like chemotaxis protein